MRAGIFSLALPALGCVAGCAPGIHAPSAYDHFRNDKYELAWRAEIRAGHQAAERWDADGSVQALEAAIAHYTRAAQAAETQEKIANPKSDHPMIAAEHLEITLMSLGMAYNDLERLPDAEASYRRALAIREGDVVWQNRPHIADVAHELADVYRRQGRTAEALPLFERAARIYNRLDMQERLTMTYHSLAHLHEAQGELAEAERLSAKALALIETKVGLELTPNHPAYAILIHYTKHYALILRKAGRIDEPRRYDDRADGMARQLDGYIASLRSAGREGEAKRIERRLEHD